MKKENKIIVFCILLSMIFLWLMIYAFFRAFIIHSQDSFLEDFVVYGILIMLIVGVFCSIAFLSYIFPNSKVILYIKNKGKKVLETITDWFWFV